MTEPAEFGEWVEVQWFLARALALSVGAGVAFGWVGGGLLFVRSTLAPGGFGGFAGAVVVVWVLTCLVGGVAGIVDFGKGQARIFRRGGHLPALVRRRFVELLLLCWVVVVGLGVVAGFVLMCPLTMAVAEVAGPLPALWSLTCGVAPYVLARIWSSPAVV